METRKINLWQEQNKVDFPTGPIYLTPILIDLSYFVIDFDYFWYIWYISNLLLETSIRKDRATLVFGSHRMITWRNPYFIELSRAGFSVGKFSVLYFAEKRVVAFCMGRRVGWFLHNQFLAAGIKQNTLHGKVSSSRK